MTGTRLSKLVSDNMILRFKTCAKPTVSGHTEEGGSIRMPLPG
jgi:hypothetical protein